MTSILTRENLDLIALQLDRAGRVEQVTGLELLKHFESIDGFWNACVKMVTPTSAELSNLLKNTEEASAWFNGSMEQIIEIGIRNQDGDLTASFCGWFDRHCSFDAAAGIRNFLLGSLRPAEFAALQRKPSEYQDKDIATKPTRQLHTTFLMAVIKDLGIQNGMSAAEFYPKVARRAIELADDEEWGQNLHAREEPGTGRLVIIYTAKGESGQVSKSISEESLRRILRILKRAKPSLLS
jgi:hypothetical protein